ncbi:MAG: TaqI-like C-terminal specificity domain-containing protein, partial [Candidatus Pacearchaeota archaeon]
QKQLKHRERGKFKKEWWQFSRPQNLGEFETVKIMTPDISNECNFTLDDKGILYHTTTIYSIAFNEKGNLNPLFYLALLNSSLMKFFIYNIGTVLRGGFTRFKPQYMNPFPIPNLDLQNSKYKTMHDKLVSLVSEIIEVKKRLYEVKLDSDKKFLEQKFELLDSQVDHLVYQLYELTEEEIQVVEEGYRK